MPTNILSKFEGYLKEEACISKNTLRFYRSDLYHFSGWLILTLRKMGIYIESFDEAIPYIKAHLITQYKEFMVKNNAPKTTINRKLSSLRNLSRFLVAANILDFDFMQTITNVPSIKEKKAHTVNPLLKGFKSHLESQSVSKNTIKNYLSDIKHFLDWLETQNV